MLASARVRMIPASGIRRYFDLADTEGVISLGVGEPDFVSPAAIRDAAIRSIEQGRTKYASNYGLLELREAVAARVAVTHGVAYDPRHEVLITAGVSEAVDLAFRATLNDGDEVLVPDPAYVAYVPGIILAGAHPVAVPTHAELGFALTAAAVERAIGPRTRAIVLGFPNNPTGSVLEANEASRIAELVRARDLVVFSDEIYERLVYGVPHVSILGAEGMRERTVHLSGFSKSYAMTGWRVGYACAPAELIEQMMKVHQYTLMSVPTASQYAALEALRSGEADVARMVEEYDRRRRLLWRRLNDIGLPCVEPKGAFYCFPRVSGTGLDDVTFCDRLLAEEKVVVIPGRAFGAQGVGHVRLCYASSLEQIEEACDRIERLVRRVTAQGVGRR